ncbi:uncharacterized protein LOC106476467, partial [Limulus polyphemus]|uniref:Uncharacterized protein LOC106476467 n=1 Tax=Limulus polyphemus TaxID=6850 RepID=A0ABM1RXD2_LIMPO
MATNDAEGTDVNHQPLELERHEEDSSEVIEPLEEQEEQRNSKTIKSRIKGGEETVGDASRHALSSSQEAPYRKIYRSLSARLPKSASKKKEESKPNDGAFFSRLALALQRKALKLTSHHKQNKVPVTEPPHKEEPSTSKEAPEGEVRLREKRIRRPRPISFGEEIPVGKEVIRFIDDSGSEISSEIDLYQYITVRKWENGEEDSGLDITSKKTEDKQETQTGRRLENGEADSGLDITSKKTEDIQETQTVRKWENGEADSGLDITSKKTEDKQEKRHETQTLMTEPSNILQTASEKEVKHETQTLVTEPSNILQTASEKGVKHETQTLVTEPSNILQTASEEEEKHETQTLLVTEPSNILQTASEKELKHETQTVVTEPSHILPKLSIRTSFKDKFFKPLFKRKSSQADDISLGTEACKQDTMMASETLSSVPKTSSDSCLKKKLNVSEHFMRMGNRLKPWKTKEEQSRTEITFPKKKPRKKNQKKPVVLQEPFSLKDSQFHKEGSEVSAGHVPPSSSVHLFNSAQMPSEEKDSSCFDTSYSHYYEVIEHLEESKNKETVEKYPLLSELVSDDKNSLDIEHTSEGIQDNTLLEKYITADNFQDNVRPDNDKKELIMSVDERKQAKDVKETIVMEKPIEDIEEAKDVKETIVMEKPTEDREEVKDVKETIVMEKPTAEENEAKDMKETIIMKDSIEEGKEAKDVKETIVIEEAIEKGEEAGDTKETTVMDKVIEEEANNLKYIMLNENLVEKELSEELKHIQHDQWIRRKYFLPKSSKPGVPPRSKKPKSGWHAFPQISIEDKAKILPNRTARPVSPVDKTTRSVSPELKTRKPGSFMERSVSPVSKPERSTSPSYSTERTISSSYKSERTPSPVSKKDNEEPAILISSDVKPIRPLRHFIPQVNLDKYTTAQIEASTSSGAGNHLSEVTGYDEIINSDDNNLVENSGESLLAVDSSPGLADKEVLEEKQKSVSFEEDVKWRTYKTTSGKEKKRPHTVMWPFSFKTPYLEKFQKFSTTVLKPSTFPHSSSKKKTPPQRPPPPKIKLKDAAVQYEENESQQSHDNSLTMEPKVEVKLLSVESEKKNVKIEDQITEHPNVEAFPNSEGKEVLSYDHGTNEQISRSSSQERQTIGTSEKEDKEVDDILSDSVSKETDLKTLLEDKNKVENAFIKNTSVLKYSKPQRPPPPDYSSLKKKISPSPQIPRSISPKSMGENLFQETKSVSPTVLKTGRQPNPPPRAKRQRSKTVEISKGVWKKDEAKVIRSQSFDKHDIKKKSKSQDKTSTNDLILKSLYTQVQKVPGSMKFYSNVENGKKLDEYPKMKFGVLRPPPPPPRYKPKIILSQGENSQNIDPTHAGDKCSSGLKEIEFETSVKEHAEIAASVELPFTQDASEESQVKVKTKPAETNLTSSEQSEELLTKENHTHELHLERLKPSNSFCDTGKDMNIENHQHQFQETGDSKVQIPDEESKSKLQNPKDEGIGPYIVEEISETKLYDESCFPECVKEDEKNFHQSSGDGVDDTLCISDSKWTSSLGSTQKHIKERTEEHKQHRASQLFSDVPEAKEDAKTDDLSYPSSDCKEKSLNKTRVEQRDLSKLDEDFQEKLRLILEKHTQKGQSEVGKDKNVYGERRKEKTVYQRESKPKIKTSPEFPSCDIEVRKARENSSGLMFSSWQEDDSSEESDNEILSLSPSINTEDKKKSKVFSIAQKIMTSEKVFVDNLRLLNEDFRRVIEEAGKEWGMPLIPEVRLNEILKYFPQLQNLNEKLLRELEERIEHWPESGRISDIFVTLGPFLKLYTSYFRDLNSTTTLIDVCRTKYPVFDHVVKEFE